VELSGKKHTHVDYKLAFIFISATQQIQKIPNEADLHSSMLIPKTTAGSSPTAR